jgi:hypothetical protein
MSEGLRRQMLQGMIVAFSIPRAWAFLLPDVSDPQKPMCGRFKKLEKSA